MTVRHSVLALALGLAALALAGCGGSENVIARLPREPGRNLTLNTGQKPVQCAPYAREHSQVKLFGDAWTWWDQAAGKFARGPAPKDGAVLVLAGYAGPERAHLAVVRQIVSPREIRIDHANWLDDGSVYLNDPVADVSENNDWSVVRVWNIQSGNWGGKTYSVQGFILPPGGETQRLARSDVPQDRQ